MSKSGTDVSVLGNHYRIRGEDPEYIKKIETYLNNKFDEINSKFDIIEQNKLFVLATFSLVDELFKVQNELQIMKEKLEKGNALIEKIITEKS